MVGSAVPVPEFSVSVKHLLRVEEILSEDDS